MKMIPLIFLIIPFSTAATSQVRLEVVCENTLAIQTNFQKNFFDSYQAATDSDTTRFTILDDRPRWKVQRQYPSDKASSFSTEKEGYIYAYGFHNLKDKQAYIEGLMDTGKTTAEMLSFHRNAYGQWTAQVSSSGNMFDDNNPNGNLYHRIYYYECITLEDNIETYRPDY
jgi:hypothetical protein